ncbi:hypothetical protein BDV33DRAFT_15558 [Aspergillus novoparasiticus]|uniref:GPI anchored serine-rich protein n=1 Tax=Aspergillus novoparasiticus TaxID=986946 RepID=A0A5N6EF20_9EURO|nr:hypothetical protein BDV33DRAFT_15558 [Aspergillus novoparasiticus]
MRFSATTIALFAGLAAALPNGEVHTVYQTEDVTITSCAPTVTDCPGRQTSTPEGVEPVTTASSSSPVIPQPPKHSSQGTTVIAVTTCIPTVTYSTITGPAGTPTGVSPGKSSSVAVIGTPAPSGHATPSSSGPSSLFTGAANTVGQSFGLAGAAAAAAFFLA